MGLIDKNQRIFLHSSPSIEKVRALSPPTPFATENLLVSSSIAKANAVATQNYEPSKPTLEKPKDPKHVEEEKKLKTNPVPHLIEMVRCLEKLGKEVSQMQKKRVEALAAKMREFTLEEAKVQEEALALSKQVGLWSFLEDLGNMILGGISSVFGYTIATTSSPLVGGMLITAGVMSVTNIVFKHADVWSYLAHEVAGEDQELEKKLLTYLPAAFGITSTALGIAGTCGAWYIGGLTPMGEFISVLNTAASLAQAGTALTNSHFRSKQSWTQADLSLLQNKGQWAKMHIQNAMEEMQEFAESQSAIMELAAQIVNSTRRGIQITQQVV